MLSIQDTNKVVLLLSLLSSHLLCICLPQPESIIVDSEVVERNGYKRDMESFGGRGFELFSSWGVITSNFSVLPNVICCWNTLLLGFTNIPVVGGMLCSPCIPWCILYIVYTSCTILLAVTPYSI